MKSRMLKGVAITSMLLALSTTGFGQSTTVSGRTVSSQGSAKTVPLNEVVLWLIPKNEAARRNSPPPAPQKARLLQKDKMFYPRLLVLPAGSSVSFPNRDPYFHNVFSLFDGKRFDLGLYEAGESRTAQFERVGVSYIFCNIHPEMSAIIVTVNTPHFVVSNQAGEFKFPQVPPGIYELHVFADGVPDEVQRKLVRTVTVGEQPIALETLLLPERKVPLHHANKYGREYEAPKNSPYEN